MLEVWGSGATYEECLAQAQACPQRKARLSAREGQTVKVSVAAFGRKFKREEQLERIGRFEALRLTEHAKARPGPSIRSARRAAPPLGGGSVRLSPVAPS